MTEFLLTIVVGIICIIIGIVNRKGNISTLHSYHRNRVRDEDILPFGRLVGLGMIIIGGAVIVNGVLSIVTLLTDDKLFLSIGIGIMIAGLIAGIGICFYAMKKYNCNRFQSDI